MNAQEDTESHTCNCVHPIDPHTHKKRTRGTHRGHTHQDSKGTKHHRQTTLGLI